jgi:putative hydroxymethylpyrimidine transport system ATP-binding protein
MTPSAIHLDAVSLSFADGSRLFDGLSLTVAAGQCTCLLGPSGCGKSTLLRLISGARDCRLAGTLRFIPDPSPAVRCAWMGQDDLLLPWFSLLDNVLLGARLRGTLNQTHIDRARKLLAEAGLAAYEQALPAALSGGMRQRGALLRTLLEERPIMLMDEPFSALDALTRMRLQNLSCRLTAGATVLLVTHDVMEALRMADRIIVLGGTPVGVKTQLDLTGRPPRRPGAPEIAVHYEPLLELLLSEAP